MKRLVTAVLAACLAAGSIFCTASMAAQEAAGSGAEETSYLGKYWTADSQAAETLRDYVERVTDPESESFIPVEDRIAVFDLDGTLMCETDPWCFEYMVFAD